MSETTGYYSREQASVDYLTAVERGDFEGLPDGEVIGFVEGRTARGSREAVFFALRRFVPYDAPDQFILFVKKQGEQFVTTWWTRENN